MIDTALNFLTQEINTYLKIKNNTPNENKIVLSSIATDSGLVIPNKSLGLSLINIEEERVFKEQRAAFLNENGKTQSYNPELRLNLYILITSNFQDKLIEDPSDDYKEGLKQLSYVILFFQSKNVFTNDNSPLLASIDPNIQRIIVELYSYSFEQLYNFWSVVGTKYLPSVLYKVRMLRFQGGSVDAELPGVAGVDLNNSAIN
ncbi:MAG: DUF4255 domain-containing protein [Bacteroidales bacterium]|nr:MAG: DUF4255 domain-containing protein [Bacteroidales bacterium]